MTKPHTRIFLLCLPISLQLVWSCGRSQERPQPAPTAQTANARVALDDGPLKTRLAAALRAKGPAYVPRTRHKNPDGSPKFTNRLILEPSPYLLQHAHNPVDWFAWGDEAFDRARALGRPVFLSIGYSTCHWCHVMEEESFEDEEIARYLNEHYVCIKVDREERPELDAQYMSFVQAFTGSGGWPMNVWLTPTREPFFGGTYFPPRAGVRGARLGLIDILRDQASRFSADPSTLGAAAHNISARLREAAAPAPAGQFPPASLLQLARTQAAQRFDPSLGGARGAPKFPSSFPLQLLLRIARRSGDAEARAMTLTTLDAMRAGGIYDQVGGGFHRYSTDARWLVPHFEKMLYDNALLAQTYLEAGQASAEARFVDTARATLDYLLRDMSASDGTFYSATDADSATASGESAEGAFFTWTPRELAAVLTQDDAQLAAAWFGVTETGNFEGRSILTQSRRAPEVASALGLTPAELTTRVALIRTQLREARARRPHPLRDEKVLVAWNGLAISALARAAIALGSAEYAQAATRAAGVLAQPIRAGQALPHALIAGQPRGSAFGEDYASLANAFVDVFALTTDLRWLDDATSLMEELERSFADTTHGGYYLSPARDTRLLVREKPVHDGPTPTVNALAALTWIRLYALTDEERFRARAETTLRAFTVSLTQNPLGSDQLLLALERATDRALEVAIITPTTRGALATEARPLLKELAHTFAPNATLLVAAEQDVAALAQRLPWLRDKVAQAGQATAYVCERGACKLPTSEPKVFASQLAP